MLLRLLIPTSIVYAAYAYVVVQLVWPFAGWSAGWSVWPFVLAAIGPLIHFSAFGFRFSGREGRVLDAYSWVSYLLLGFFAFAFVLSLVRDASLLLLYLANAVFAFLPEDTTPLWQGAGAVVLGGAVVATVAGFFGAVRLPRVNRVEARIRGLPASFDGYTLAQLTDVHIGPTIKRPFIEGLVARTNGLGADAIVITGDLIDGTVDALAHDAAPLASLEARDGVFYVTGNHEFYAGVDPWVLHLRSLGMRVLENESVHVEREGARLAIAGIHDYSAAHVHRTLHSDIPSAMDGIEPGTPRVLLAHQPRSVHEVGNERVDLMLTGHTHGGQFVPWNFFVPLQQPHVAGMFTHGDTQVWVSRGAGYWGPPVRLFAASEITLMTLRPA